MESSYYFFLLTSLLVLGALISVMLLVFSSNNTQIEYEKAKEEEQQNYHTRRSNAANKATLEYLMLKEEKASLKILHIDNMAVDKKHRVSVVGLRERHRVPRQRTKEAI